MLNLMKECVELVINRDFDIETTTDAPPNDLKTVS